MTSHRPSLDVPRNIVPTLLPPRVPKMNPVEAVCQFVLPRQPLSNLAFETHDDVIDAACDALLKSSHQARDHPINWNVKLNSHWSGVTPVGSDNDNLVMFTRVNS
jgi:hypothetical protein